MREQISAVLGHRVCHNLLQQPQEPNTPWNLRELPQLGMDQEILANDTYSSVFWFSFTLLFFISATFFFVYLFSSLLSLFVLLISRDCLPICIIYSLLPY